MPAGAIYQFGPFEANSSSGELFKQGRRIKLQQQPFRLLVILLENPGTVVTQAEIQSRVWDRNTFVDFSSSLRVAVRKLRDALGDDADNPRYIETIPKRGYRLLIPAARSADPTHSEAILNDAAIGAPSGADGMVRSQTLATTFPIAEPTRYQLRGARVATAITVVATIAVLAGGGWFYRAHTRGEVIDSIAVLPFVNGSGDPNMEYLSDGIAEALIDNLSQLPNLRVMSRESAFRYKSNATDARSVGKALGVRAVFEGRIVQQGDRLAISAELNDARDNSQIWGTQYSSQSSDIFALQRDIATDITGALRTKLTGADKKLLTESHIASPEAYQFYLKGRFWWGKRSEEGYDKAIGYFEQAIQQDSNYAPAYAGLADCYTTLGSTGIRPPREVLPKAKEAATRALEIDATLGEARPSLAFLKGVYDWDWAGAEKDFQRAIALNPNYAESYQWYGQILARMGRFDEAVAEHRHALDLDPLALVTNRNLAQDFIGKREYDQAIEQLRNTIALDPNFISAHSYLGTAYTQKSMYKESIAEFEEGLRLSPDDPCLLANLGYAYGVAGKKAEALKVLAHLGQIAKQRYVSPAYIAFVYAGLGDKDQTFASLEKAYEDRSIALSAIGIKWNPIWDPFRSDPRFADLVRRVNL